MKSSVADKLVEDKLIVDKLIEEFGEELYFKDFLNKYSSWLLNVTSEEQVIFNKLLGKLKFYSKSKIKSLLKKKLFDLKSKYQNFEYTNIVPMVSADRRYNGSYELIASIKEIDREEAFQNNELIPYKETIIMDTEYIDKDSDNVIIIDDICGTGETLDKFLKKNSKYFIGKNIIVLFLVATNLSITNFENIIKKYKQFTLNIDYCDEEDKLSNHDYLTDEELILLCKLETSLWNPASNNIMGYKNSQLLIGFSHNIPNNTISSLWYYPELGKRKKWNPLFRRYTKQSKKGRNRQNYKVKANGKGKKYK